MEEIIDGRKRAGLMKTIKIEEKQALGACIKNTFHSYRKSIAHFFLNNRVGNRSSEGL